jgi:tetratricopeptide (TPR) repeat protein
MNRGFVIVFIFMMLMVSAGLAEAQTEQQYMDSAAFKVDNKDYKGAMADLSKIIKMDPASDAAYNNRGCIKMIIKDNKGAIEDFGAALKINPNNFQSVTNRGALRLLAKDYPGAIKDLKAAIAIDHKNAGTYLNLGCAQDGSGNFNDAMTCFNTALKINPKFYWAYDGRAITKCHIKDYSGAVEDCVRAISYDKKFAEAYYYKGQAEKMLGKKDEAKKDLATAASLGYNKPTDAFFMK